MNFNVLSFILALGVFQGFFMAILLLCLRNEKFRQNRILAVLLLDLSLILINLIFTDAGYRDMNLVRLVMTPMLFVIGPLIFFYINQNLSLTSVFSLKDALHLVPAGLVILYYLPKYFFIGWMPFINYRFMTFFFWHAFIAHFLAYLFIMTRLTRKPFYKGLFDSDTSSLWIAFLYKFFAVAFVMMIIVTVYDMSRLFFGFSGIRLTESTLALFGVFLICTVSFKGLMNPAIFFGKRLKESGGHSGKAVTVEKIQNIMERLELVMENEKPYLDAKLTLPALADMTGCPRSDLSTAINAAAGKKFFKYINSFRVKRAKELLLENGGISIIEAAYKSGFNSKSTFNDAFKRATGVTPSEFKKTGV